MPGEDQNTNTTTPSTPNTNEPKMGLLDRASAWGRRHPIGTTFGAGVAANVAVKAGERAYTAIKDRFTEKAAAPAQEQAAGFVSGVARSFAGKIGKW